MYVLVLFFQIISKGNIVDVGNAAVNGSLNITIDKEMAPSARFVVYFIQPDGEIVADGFNFVVEDIFENKVSTIYDESP